MSFWQVVDFGGDTIIFHVIYFLDYEFVLACSGQ